MDAIFTFGGRIGRVAYLVRVMVVSMVGGLVVGAAFLLPMLVGGASRGALSVSLLFGGIAGLALLAASFGLMTRRLRDIGLPPLPVILGLTAFAIVDMLVIAPRFPAPVAVHGSYHASLIGALVHLAATAMLLFWPSRSDCDPPPRRPAREAFVPVADGPRPEMARVPVRAARGFGHRGAIRA